MGKRDVCTFTKSRRQASRSNDREKCAEAMGQQAVGLNSSLSGVVERRANAAQSVAMRFR